MELRHLRYFVAVAEEGNITRAAERLGMQQPPLSQQIRALESELKVQLFQRKPRGVELTDTGRALLEEARAVLDHVEDAMVLIRRTVRGEQGRIAVGFTSSSPFYPFVPRVIRTFRETFPQVHLSLDERGTTELVEELRSGKIDVAFIRSPVSDPMAVAVYPLLKEDMLLALPHNHALARKIERPLPLETLAGEAFILYRRPVGPGLYDTIITACREAGFSPNIVQEAPRIVSTLNLVAAGFGVSIVPESLKRLQMDGVVYRQIKHRRGLVAPLNLASRRGGHSPTVSRFIDLVRRTAKTFQAY